MTPIHLTKTELQEITGKVKGSAQVRILRLLGFTVKVRPDGLPLVSRSHFESVMGGIGLLRKEHEVQPDFSVF